MKKSQERYVWMCALFLVFILMFPMVEPMDHSKESSQRLYNAPDISLFQMDLGPGTQSGSFQEYLSNHPYAPSEIITRFSSNNQIDGQKKISILVDQDIYTSTLQEKLDHYIQDLINESVEVITIDTITGGNPVEVKDWLTIQYQHGVIGAMFIGDIPAAWADVSGEVFPCDLFYMDMDGVWTDGDKDGIYETHQKGTGDLGPEIFVSRLYTGSLEWNDEETMLIEYFDKIHSYRTGSLIVPWRGLEYIDEDWYTMDVSLADMFYENISHYDYGYLTTGNDFLDHLCDGQFFTTVCAHSYPGGHYFGRRPTEAACYAHVYIYSPLSQQVTLLLGADDGIKVWLNGEVILTADVLSGWEPDRYQIDVSLHEGWNRLLCKVSQEGGDYKMSVGFVDHLGQPIPDFSYQINNPSIHGMEGEFIRSWLVNGFHQDTSNRFFYYLSTNYLDHPEGSTIPVEGMADGGSIWTCFDSGYPYIDLDGYADGADYGVTYAYTCVHAQQPITCELWCGYDDGMKAWLNGEVVIDDNRNGDYIGDMTKVPVTLSQGDNHLLVKISEWMGSSGFSARFCTENGEKITGLTYTPSFQPISYIGEWLITGPFENPDVETRLTTSYLPNEADLTPSSDEGSWESGYGQGYPFDLGAYFNHGDWVFSETIQSMDPPCLFYNLFACSAGRYTDTNYLAGSYIFNTSYGLVSIASTKSGSMLEFNDFTEPLGLGKTIGEAFMDWFSAQEPLMQWQREWYYGMIVCGDPLLTVSQNGHPTLSIEISSPTDGIYLSDIQLFSFFTPVVFGTAEITVDIINPGYGIDEVRCAINGKDIGTDDSYPYQFTYDEPMFGRQEVMVTAVDYTGDTVSDSLTFWKFF